MSLTWYVESDEENSKAGAELSKKAAAELCKGRMDEYFGREQKRSRCVESAREEWYKFEPKKDTKTSLRLVSLSPTQESPSKPPDHAKDTKIYKHHIRSSRSEMPRFFKLLKPQNPSAQARRFPWKRGNQCFHGVSLEGVF